METQVELSIASSYVPDWGYVEAIRELVQNAVDQERVNDSAMVLEYDWETEVLRITSKGSRLGRASLLLGHTTKAECTDTIGSFGEGYKLALMVLSRLQLAVEVENYGAGEKWVPSIITSRAFSADVLSINIIQMMHTTSHNDLVFSIHSVTQEMMNKVTESNLHFTSYPQHLDTSKGRILVEPTNKGKLFVAGLFVQTVPELRYGYDFNPVYVSLDRDRRMISTFELTWLTGQLWCETSEAGIINDMLKINAMDTKHYGSHSCSSDNTAEHVHAEFITEHGPTAVPVQYQCEVAEMKALGRKPIICSEAYARVVQSVVCVKDPIISVPQKQPHEFLEELVDRPTGSVIPDIYNKLCAVIKEAEDWSL